MRVHVVDEGGWDSAQARAYAEYRLFAALAQYGSLVQGAQIVLRYEGEEGPAAFLCRMAVTLERPGVVRTRVCAPHAYAAIDRAVERIGRLIRRHGARPVSS